MRLAVFTFSLVLIFAPVYAYAFIPFMAARGLIAKTASGVYKKIPLKRELLGIGGITAVSKWCSSNKKCKELLGEAEDFLGLDDDDNSSCQAYTTVYGMHSLKTYQSLDSAVMSEINYLIEQHNKMYGYKMSFVSYDEDSIDIAKKQHDNIVNQLKSTSKKSTTYNQTVNGRFTAKFTWNHGATEESPRSVNLQLKSKIICNNEYTNDDDKAEHEQYKEQRKQEQIQKIVQNMSDDDITYIINNYKDDIDIDKYCAESGSCDELSKEFGNEVTKNKGKYDIDKINKANCEVKNGKIVSCEGAKVQLELDFESEEDPKTEEETQEGKEEETVCDTSDLTKEICEYLDWVDDEAEEPTDTKVEIEEPSDEGLDEEMINIMKSCPADIRFDVTMLGHSMNLKMSTMPFCLVAENIRPYIIGAGTLSALFILAGIRRE